MLRDVTKITINQTGINVFYRVNFAIQLILVGRGQTRRISLYLPPTASWDSTGKGRELVK